MRAITSLAPVALCLALSIGAPPQNAGTAPPKPNPTFLSARAAQAHSASRPHPNASSLPHPGFIVARWSPDDIANLNGGTTPSGGVPISAWADSVNRVTLTQSAANRRPIFRTRCANNKPCLAFSGAQYLSIAADPALRAAFTSGKGITIMAFYANARPSSGGVMAQLKGPADFLAAGSTTAASEGARYGIRTPAGALPYDGSVGSSAVQSITFATYAGIARQGDLMAANGATLSIPWSAPYAPGIQPQDGTFTLGYLTNPDRSYSGNLYDVIIWSRSLTPAEILQAQKWASRKYGQKAPSDSYGKIWVAVGDSQTYGPQAANYVIRTARALSLPMGTWMNVGQRGRTTSELDAWSRTDLDGIPAVAGVPVNLSLLAFYNQRFQPAPGRRNLDYASNRRAAGFARIAMLTLLDDGAHWSGRTAFIAELEAGYAAAGVSDLVRVDRQGNAGTEGVGVVGSAFPGSPSFAPDLIHPNEKGQADIQHVLQPVVAGW